MDPTVTVLLSIDMHSLDEKGGTQGTLKWTFGVTHGEASESKGETNTGVRGIPRNMDSVSFSATLPRPTLWAVPGPVVPKGANVTLRCQGPLGSDRFQLWKDGELREERNASWELAEFVLRQVNDVTDARSYRCRSGQGPWWSELSEPLALVVTGPLPRPTLWAQPGLVVNTGANVTLWCSRPKLPSLEGVTFTLWKAGTREPLRQQSSAEPWTSFLLPSVRPQDTGSYSCAYREGRAPARGSEPSEALELVVPGSLPKPFLSVWPGPEVTSGSDVTLLCWGPSRATRFILYKEGDEKDLTNTDASQNESKFFLTHVTPKDSGSYSCQYQLVTNGSLLTQHSDPLELIVRGAFTSSSSSSAFFCCYSCVMDTGLWGLYKEAALGAAPVALVFLGICPVSLRPPERKPCVSMAEVTHTQLNLRTLNKKKPHPQEKATQPSLYATVYLD
ncbi:immunoglobulin superfamily member 1-like [Dromiciops gliroides]|uniref:immunoglobulin superfamily member 1-like n=1 Tax=Dromiciops gliroides TaxID=33562 RepID=UPI001CC378D6|nr:immunoglobulin superfamily member 1-like [Dromiciops gliroides]